MSFTYLSETPRETGNVVVRGHRKPRTFCIGIVVIIISTNSINIINYYINIIIYKYIKEVIST